MENVSSEEQLLQLRNEGKVSEAEYNDLLNAMRKSPFSVSDVSAQKIDKKVSKRTLGKIAFYLMIAGIVIPIMSFFVGFAISGGGEGDVIFMVCFILGILMEIPAFVFGVISWPDIYGKATVTSVSAVVFLALLFRPSPDVQISRNKPEEIVRRFPLDNTEGLIARSHVTIDKQISSDGNGSLRIEVTQSTTVRLFETGDMDIGNARLVYQAKVRTENIQGKVFLEMWCSFPGKGEFFSKGLMQPLTGTFDWTTLETPFLLKKGENPDNIKLNLVIDGKGTVWIDDIRLIKHPLG